MATGLSRTTHLNPKSTWIPGKSKGSAIDIRTQAYISRDGHKGGAAKYYDYFFSGSDIFCYIKGAPNYDLSIVALAYSIQQTKTPVYGMWSYTFDHVLHGSRIVQGQMILNYRSQNYLLDAISDAVKNKNVGADDFLPSLTTTDQANIDKYWGVTQLDSSTREKLTKHLFVSHPPFDLVCVWGMQPETISSAAGGLDDISKGSFNDFLSKDLNSRLLDPGKLDEGRFALVSVELTSMALQVDPSGDPVTEQYSFIARDISPVIGSQPKTTKA